MQAFWAYRKPFGRDDCDLETSGKDRISLYYSPLLFKKKFPEAETVFLVDSYVKQLLERWNVYSNWDRVIEVNFEDWDRSQKLCSFFAYPKLVSMLYAEEDFWIIDTDHLVNPVERFKGFTRDAICFLEYGVDCWSTPPEIVETGVPAFDDIYRSRPSAQGTLIYYPNCNVARVIALALMSIGRDLAYRGEELFGSQNHWRYFEENTIPWIVDFLGLRHNRLLVNALEIYEHENIREYYKQYWPLVRKEVEKLCPDIPSIPKELYEDLLPDVV